MRRGERILKYWLPVLLWMAVIFVGSTDLMSSGRTSRIIGPILRWFNKDVAQETIDRVQYVVRKCAHVTEYAVLALLLRRAVNTGNSHAPNPLPDRTRTAGTLSPVREEGRGKNSPNENLALCTPAPPERGHSCPPGHPQGPKPTGMSALRTMVHGNGMCLPSAPSARAGASAFRTNLIVLLVVALYAASDEAHQSFVASRYASAMDVLYDTAGGALGLALAAWWSCRRTRSSD